MARLIAAPRAQNEDRILELPRAGFKPTEDARATRFLLGSSHFSLANISEWASTSPVDGFPHVILATRILVTKFGTTFLIEEWLV